MQVPFRLRQAVRQMWFLPTIFSLGAIATVAAARYSAFLLPEELPFDISQDAIDHILTIVASSMLAVATFALATMVNALAGASQRTTPRAVRLVAEDRAAQTSISAFVGAFLFSIVGIIALRGGLYSASGRLILFAATSVVVLVVVGALIRWINKISSIGHVGEIIERVEDATTTAFREAAQRPCFGCNEQSSAPEEGFPVHAREVGMSSISIPRSSRPSPRNTVYLFMSWPVPVPTPPRSSRSSASGAAPVKRSMIRSARHSSSDARGPSTMIPGMVSSF
jgi:uncharacterized membrane protein